MSDHHERREYNIEMAHTLGRIEGKLDSLCGEEGRVTKLETAQTRQWWLQAAVIPAFGILHTIAKKLGI